MTLSVRNQLSGVVKEVKVGAVMAEVVVKVGDNQLIYSHYKRCC